MHKRSDRLRALFLEEISLLLQGLKDPGLAGLLTVTGLELSRDMKTARVFYSILGSREDRRSTGEALNRSAPYLRSRLLERLRLKFIPALQFLYDETPERAHRVEEILARLKDETPPPPPSELDRLGSRRARRRKRR